MKTNKFVVMLVVLVMLLGGFSTPVSAGAEWSKVDQRVLNQLETNGTADFHVVMAVQADVSGAAQLDTKLEKTTYVFDLLTQTAARTQAPILAQLQAEGVTYESFYIYNMISITGAGRSTLQWLAARPEVARIVSLPDPRKEPTPTDVFGPLVTVSSPASAAQSIETIEWNILRVNADDVWAMGDHGEGMVVASNDTGVDYTHPALVGKYRGNLGGGNFDHNYNWWDGASGYDYPHDYDGHGTHTTGTMVGDDGGSNQIGVAPGAQWIACGGLGGTDPIDCFQFFLAPWDLNGQNPLPEKAPDSINNSWYDPSGYDYRPIILALNAAGIAVIKSAGNNGPSCGSISNPGYVPEIIATAAFGQGDVIASFSSRGPMSNYGETILKPEVAAPGVNVRSSVPGGGYEGGWSGTSMAAPHTTATVALIWSAAPCLQGDVPATKLIMEETAEEKIDAQCPPFVSHPNDVWGYGILDAKAAVDAALVYCGGLGTLEGTVTDAGNGSFIEGAQVRAEGSGGYSKTVSTDAMGFYSMQLPEDAYTVSATAYGYQPDETGPVDVFADQTTVQDFALPALPVYTVSGYVKETGTNLPLEGAKVEFTDGIPVAPVFTDNTGFYSIDVVEGTWHLKASADLHLPQTIEVAVDGNLSQNFFLDPLPCILLVDDDQNGPDVRSAYTDALDDLGYSYAVWDVSADGDPAEADILGYMNLLWFTGYPYSNTFNGDNEAAVSAYLDAGGNFFLSSQDYLYDMNLTLFGQNYLRIASYTSDVGQTTVTGANVFAGLGPYTLAYPFTNYSDIVLPGAGALTAFNGDFGSAAISYASGTFNTAFFGYPFEAIPQLADRSAVLGTMIDFFGGCGEPSSVSIMPPTQGLSGAPGTQVTFEYVVTNLAAEPQEVGLSLTGNTWVTEVQASTGELGPGASTTVPVLVTIPMISPEQPIGSDTFTLIGEGSLGGPLATATGTTTAEANLAVELTAPENSGGAAGSVVAYEFLVTNTGEYTDSYTLELSGVWNATLPGGNNTGLLAPGASTAVIVEVEIPSGALPGDMDITTLSIQSDLYPALTVSGEVTTTVFYGNLFPIIIK